MLNPAPITDRLAEVLVRSRVGRRHAVTLAARGETPEHVT